MLKVSVITPTFYRQDEIPGYLYSLANQSYKPFEIILVDGAPISEQRTELLIANFVRENNLPIKYFRHEGGTAIQRNYGISKSNGDLILFVDDDVRLAIDFIEKLANLFEVDFERKIGGITGYRENCYFDMSKSSRWRWYKRLKLLKEFTPGKYDFETGYPINNNGMHPFTGVREVDFMTTACTAYRSEILKDEVSFDPFFVGYGILEDAHLALNIKKRGYNLLQCGDAKAIELTAPTGRTNKKTIGERTVINYYYVFNSICGPLTTSQKVRFFNYQLFEMARAFADIIRFTNKTSWHYFQGKIIGIVKLLIGINR